MNAASVAQKIVQDQYSHANNKKRNDNVRPRWSHTATLFGPMYGIDNSFFR